MAKKRKAYAKTEDQWDKQYSEYLELYLTEDVKLKQAGKEWNKKHGDLLTKTQFKQRYTQLLNTEKERVIEGKIKSVGSIVIKLVRWQKAPASAGQMKALTRDRDRIETMLRTYNLYDTYPINGVYDEKGKEISPKWTVEKIASNLDEILSAINSAMINAGVGPGKGGGYVRQEQISMTFFGSN